MSVHGRVGIAETVTVRRGRFRAGRFLAVHQHLRAAARAVDCWGAEPEAAPAVLRDDARRERGGWYGEPVLIDALLDGGDLDAARREAADSADDRQWQQLGDLSCDACPADALAVQEPTGDRVYERLARLLLGVRDCHRALGTRRFSSRGR
ncbi:hypothetical protein ACOT81_42295 [Streptomyces sp. WI04-05B]|uniref:hypothetical protein n=1 Tax=Streptomyces TaxID=1883 RepID=UPI0029ADF434|nr:MULTISPECIES: hypothetical protein [unclassified Streptomyces]MDX2547830.1 hypothetical protein [Streptomyces sp. WI04-05B]MDX2583066.1 hypothetical protein [Streptomyces sp. WI04-05A]